MGLHKNDALSLTKDSAIWVSKSELNWNTIENEIQKKWTFSGAKSARWLNITKQNNVSTYKK